MSTWYQNLRTKTCSLRLRAFTPGLTPGVLSPISDSRGPEQRVRCEPTPPCAQDTGAMTRSAGDNPMPVPLYQPTSGSPLSVDAGFYERLGHEITRRTLVKQL